MSDTTDGEVYKNVGTVASPSWADFDAIVPSEITLAEGQVLVGNSSGVGAASSAGAITFKSLSAGATGVVLTGYHDSASPAASDVVLSVVGQGEDSAGNAQVYTTIDSVIQDATSTSEDADLVVSNVVAGALTERLRTSATNVTVTPAATGNLVVAGARGVASSEANNFAVFRATGAQATPAPTAAIPLTNYNSTLDSTAGATTQTLAAGDVVGKVKRIQMIVDGGDDVVTVTSLSGGTTITFADVGDVAELMWDGTNWIAVALYNIADGVTAPVLA